MPEASLPLAEVLLRNTGLGKQAEQLAIAFDETAQDAGDGKSPVAMRDGS